ncbi:RNA polymerase subunit sigma [Mesorhizobium sp. SARCC-RB16n]|uniref:sigma factor n=1 Tax=Mesorhizobium sp. SARCC-RB16n TaxID=2116687 RepID=UPI00122F2CDB|nr:sigma factor [Mesorhizobium sp. SARCC-RB16n]KAA3452296.1 RNA polymerase subunit sigma [Mesorhizobium sp. SARCC-RB16n]
MAEHRRKLNISGHALAEPTQSPTPPGSSSPLALGEQTSLVDLVPALRAFARSLCGSIDEADDLVRETLIKAIAGLEGLDGSRVRPWIFATMRRVSLARHGGAAPQPHASFGCLSESSATSTPAYMQAGPKIACAIDRLPGPEREATVLVCMLGLSHEDAADICDCDTATIKARIRDARTSMAVLLGAETSAAPEKPN